MSKTFHFDISPGIAVEVLPPTVGLWNGLLCADTLGDTVAAAVKIMDRNISGTNVSESVTLSGCMRFIGELSRWLSAEKKAHPEYRVPYCPPEKKEERRFSNSSADMKLAADYTGLNFLQLGELDIFKYWRLLHDAAVWYYEGTPAGREYLERAWLYSQTKADTKEIREYIKHGK